MHLATDLNNHLDRIVEVPRIENNNRLTTDTLIGKESLLFAKYLRNKKKDGTKNKHLT